MTFFHFHHLQRNRTSKNWDSTNISAIPMISNCLFSSYTTDDEFLEVVLENMRWLLAMRFTDKKNWHPIFQVAGWRTWTCFPAYLNVTLQYLAQKYAIDSLNQWKWYKVIHSNYKSYTENVTTYSKFWSSSKASRLTYINNLLGS